MQTSTTGGCVGDGCHMIHTPGSCWDAGGTSPVATPAVAAGGSPWAVSGGPIISHPRTFIAPPIVDRHACPCFVSAAETRAAGPICSWSHTRISSKWTSHIATWYSMSAKKIGWWAAAS